ncbi:NAD-dependent epimerase [Prochlorococcus marinus]|uniref:NAD-dependent epimerase n=1 Tax=Prochlorococcus marinus TaxID=1219 RepID=UPI00019005CB|nr:NAD-dependent epimerase [Prochlorococcus marinus]EEE40842.1 NAD dependent epimerase/dehydratase [Prochlorococcus marinus str. MIT 9202]
MRILVTGAAGFIGFHLCKKLLELNKEVIGFDNVNDYYERNLKYSRLSFLKDFSENTKSKFTFYEKNLEDNIALKEVFKKHEPDIVFNLAGQAGVRYSIENPSSYIQSNLVGFGNILESCKESKVKNLIYASSSSVYGGNRSYPFSEDQSVDHPVSLYAATKKANELMAHSYSHIYKIPTIGLRFFTVYGPWGRPDMALFSFTKSIYEKKPIRIFNHGQMIRDFTYIDDIIECLIRIIKKPPKPNPKYDHLKVESSSSWAPYKIFNIGNSNPVNLMTYIEEIEKATGIKAKKIFTEMQPGDVKKTFACTDKLDSWIGFTPKTKIKEGIYEFVKWYKEFYSL